MAVTTDVHIAGLGPATIVIHDAADQGTNDLTLSLVKGQSRINFTITKDGLLLDRTYGDFKQAYIRSDTGEAFWSDQRVYKGSGLNRVVIPLSLGILFGTDGGIIGPNKGDKVN
mgnify:CR=1 FL=1